MKPCLSSPERIGKTTQFRTDCFQTDSACSSRPRLHGHTLVGAWEQGLNWRGSPSAFRLRWPNDGSPGMCFILFGLLCNSEPVLPVLQLDNAGWHTPENLPVPDGIRLVYQPPRTPELQPAEHLWPLIDEPLANKHFETIEHLDAAIAERYCDLAGKKSLIASHTKFHCITINDPRIAPTRLAASGSQRIELRTLLALGSVAVRAEGKCLLGNSRLGFPSVRWEAG